MGCGCRWACGSLLVLGANAVLVLGAHALLVLDAVPLCCLLWVLAAGPGVIIVDIAHIHSDAP